MMYVLLSISALHWWCVYNLLLLLLLSVSVYEWCGDRMSDVSLSFEWMRVRVYSVSELCPYLCVYLRPIIDSWLTFQLKARVSFIKRSNVWCGVAHRTTFSFFFFFWHVVCGCFFVFMLLFVAWLFFPVISFVHFE